MEAVTNRYKQVADIMLSAIDEIKIVLTDPDDAMLLLSTISPLEKSAHRLLLLTGNEPAATETKAKLGPAKTIGGKPIITNTTIKDPDLYHTDQRMNEFKSTIADGENKILGMEPEVALVEFDDLTLRGMAKTNGMKVTKDDPSVLTPEFILDLQLAIRDNQEAKGKKSTKKK